MTMKTRLKKLAVALVLVAVLLSAVLTGLSVASVEPDSARVDVFTQREPYSGRGVDRPSDAFGPEDFVILHGLVTYNDAPVDCILVAFNVRVPSGAHFTISARTNASGMATVSFTVLTPPTNVSESDVFGVWFVLGNVLMDGDVFQDTLTFKVDWIVKLLSVRTIDENLTYRDSFGKGSDIGLEITLRSIAMTVKNATVAFVIEDELGVPVNFSIIRNLAVSPNEKVVHMYCMSTLPKWAVIGNAIVFVSALTDLVASNGVAYCPSISTGFLIGYVEPLVIHYHDASVVAVVASADLIEIGQSLSLKTLVSNQGTTAQNFTVSTYLDNTLLGTFDVKNLLPYSTATFNLNVKTSLLTVGNHTVSAHIPVVVDEADLTDNDFTGIVEVRPKPTVKIHDVAVTGIKLSNSNVFIGETEQINVTVVNKGTETETFGVSVYCNSSLVQTRLINDLPPSAQATLVYSWNTTAVEEGNYQISASAPLATDANPADNTFVNGFVQVRTRPPILPVHDVAIFAVHPTESIVIVGDNVEILVVAENLGEVAESFNVAAFGNSSVVGVKVVEGLGSGLQTVVIFEWDTEGVVAGNYTVSARASNVTGEKNHDNNLYVDGLVQVKARTPVTPVHDVAVTRVVPLSRFVYIGDYLDVNVTVRNKGTEAESFDVVLYYDERSVAGVLHVDGLVAGAERTVVFHWQTNGVSVGNHTLSANSKPVQGETLVGDNTFVDGQVKFGVAPGGLFVPDWLYWFLLLLLLLLLMLLLLLSYYRKRKENKASFYAGWTAWYYGYDPRAKPRKT